MDTGQTLQLIGSLFLVLATIVLVAWLLRRVNGIPRPSGQMIKLLGGLSLGARERLMLVEVGGKHILLAATPGRISRIHVFEQALDLEDMASKQGFPGFSQALQAARGAK